MRKALKNL